MVQDIPVLLIGGHGKVAQLLTPLLLARWNVTSLIRTAEQKPAIEKLGQDRSGRLTVLVRSIEDVKNERDAQKILDEAKPEWVIWSAGAGGRGGASRTFAVDRDAAIAFTRASIHTPSVKKFLNVSYLASRRGRAPWWNDEDWASARNVNSEVLPDYFKAKVAADEVLTVLAKQRFDEEASKGIPLEERFCGISLRPGTLTDEPAGRVTLGKTPSRGKTSRATVAETILAVLEDNARGWVDVLDGPDDIAAAVKTYINQGVDGVEGEDLEGMKQNIADI